MDLNSSCSIAYTSVLFVLENGLEFAAGGFRCHSACAVAFAFVTIYMVPRLTALRGQSGHPT